jgi:hypothetical protein
MTAHAERILNNAINQSFLNHHCLKCSFLRKSFQLRSSCQFSCKEQFAMRTMIMSISCLLASACAAIPQKSTSTGPSQLGAAQFSCDQLVKAEANVNKTLKLYERARANFRSNVAVAFQAQQSESGAWGNVNSATNSADLTAGNIAYQLSQLKGTQLDIFQAMTAQKCAPDVAPAAK